MSPTNPFGGSFSSQQMAQMIQHQRFTEAFQRQAHEQQVSAQQLTRDTRQYPMSIDTDQANSNSDNDIKPSQNTLQSRQLTNSARPDLTSNLVCFL